MTTKARSALIALFFLLQGSAASAQAASREDVEKARTLFEAGNASFKRKEWAAAEVFYKEAWELAHSFDVAGNLGEVELHLGKSRDAARFLAYDLKHAPPSTTPEQRERAEHFLAEARRGVCAIKVKVNVEAPVVRLDGKPLEKPDEALELFVDPGLHTLEVTQAGYTTISRRVEVPAASTQEVAFELLPDRSAPQPPGPTNPGNGGASLPIVIAGSGVAGLGILGGFVFMALSNGKAGDAKTTAAGLTSPCPPGGSGTLSPACQSLSDALGSRDGLATASVVSFVIGAAAAGATGVYLVLAPSKTQAPVARVVPVISPSAQGVVFQARW